MSHFDVIVIGAGAAGMAAASALALHGQAVCVLEARARTGGRIFTVREHGLPVPIELGAELVHGRSPTTSLWLRKANSGLIDVAHERWRMKSGTLSTGDTMFDEMKRALARLPKPKKDLPFAEFLETSRGRLSPAIRQFARMLVEGFDAADATRVSTLQILEEWSGSAAADAPTFRPLGGYGALIDAIANSFDPKRVSLSLNTVVQAVTWQRGRVTVSALKDGQQLEFSAAKAVVALPLGVLKEQTSRAIKFTPSLTHKEEALSLLGVGPVIKACLYFRQAFWEQLDDGKYADAAFLHSPNAVFPTMWTALPIRAPLLVAWAGGPHAIRLSSKSDEEIVQAALGSVQALFPGRRALINELQSAHVHNWQTDPFARGAYSYVIAGGAEARRQLARPLSATLFFAGEAVDTTGEAATVAGALQSGERVAKQIIASLSRS